MSGARRAFKRDDGGFMCGDFSAMWRIVVRDVRAERDVVIVAL